MQSDIYTFYDSCLCCCYKAKAVKHICDIKAGYPEGPFANETETHIKKEYELNPAKTQEGQLELIAEWPVYCCFSCLCLGQIYYRIELNGYQSVRTDIPLCCNCACWRVHEIFTHRGKSKIGQVKPRSNCSGYCPYMIIESVNEDQIYEMRGPTCPIDFYTCFCCDIMWDINDNSGNKVGEVKQNGCPMFSQCCGAMFATEIRMPANSTPEEKQLIAASLPFALK